MYSIIRIDYLISVTIIMFIIIKPSVSPRRDQAGSSNDPGPSNQSGNWGDCDGMHSIEGFDPSTVFQGWDEWDPSQPTHEQATSGFAMKRMEFEICKSHFDASNFFVTQARGSAKSFFDFGVIYHNETEYDLTNGIYSDKHYLCRYYFALYEKIEEINFDLPSPNNYCGDRKYGIKRGEAGKCLQEIGTNIALNIDETEKNVILHAVYKIYTYDHFPEGYALRYYLSMLDLSYKAAKTNLPSPYQFCNYNPYLREMLRVHFNDYLQRIER